MIVETHTGRPLSPMVGDDHGRVRDLSLPSAPTIWEVEEDTPIDVSPNRMLASRIELNDSTAEMSCSA